MRRLSTLVLLCAALLLSAGTALAAGPDAAAGTVNLIQDAATLEKVRSSEAGSHFLKMAEELRQVAEAQAKGLPLPELTTDQQPLRQKNGINMLRLGTGQLHFFFVDARSGEAVPACHASSSSESRSGRDLTNATTDALPES